MAFMDCCSGFQSPLFESATLLPAFHPSLPLTASTTYLYLKVQAIIPPFMSKSTTAHPKGQSSIIPQIEKLLTEQTSVILQAVDEKLSTQNRRIDAVERKV